MRKASLFLFIIIHILNDGCVNRLDFNVDELSSGSLVVDGNITDEPGPYSVRLFRASNIDDILNFTKPVIAREVSIADNSGFKEILKSSHSGVYQTSPDGIRGEIGKEYTLHIELTDGSIYESKPEKLLGTAVKDSVYFTFESFEPLNAPTRYGFRVFLDTKGLLTDNDYLRWKFSGVYKVLTYPEKHLTRCPTGLPDPRPCSGTIWTGTFIKRIGPCTCCYCWVSDFESKPMLSVDEILTDGSFKKVELGYVPINQWTFSLGKYMVRIEQMSLTKEAFEFWKVIKDQKEGLTSLFQPSFGRTKTNIFSTNTDNEVLGMFYAASIKKNVIFITGENSPISTPPLEVPVDENCPLWDSCEKIFPDSNVFPPPEWK